MTKKENRKEKLLNVINRLDTAGRERFAEHVGTSLNYLRQIAYGFSPCRVDYAAKIDEFTGSEVAMEYLCPDVDWVYVAKAMKKKGRPHDSDPQG